MITYREQVEIAAKISKSFSTKTSIDYDDLFSEALSKLPNIEKNYISQMGSNFTIYLKSSLRGYLKNYIRDHGFTVKLRRKILDIYMSTRKYSSYLIASLHTKWSEDEIRDAHETVSKFRAYNVSKLEPWSVTQDLLEDAPCKYDDAVFICQEADIDQNLLLDYFIHRLPSNHMQKKYGKLYMKKVVDQSTRLKSIAINQGYFDE